jgi:hypothetical protein
MSDPDKRDENTADDDKGFLTRWSQRKREANQPDPEPPVARAEVTVAEADAEPPFDLSSLPRLEDLTATTDITAFLGKGVPEQLRNAALRKSWALDPAIRNYVNPALDYAYDWNTPGGVPGSSELGAGMDVARLVSQIMGDSAAEPALSTADRGDSPSGDPAPSPEPTATPQPKLDLPSQTLRLGNETTAPELSNVGAGAGIAAGQAQDSEHGPSAAPQQVVRRHGSAKPQL